MQRHCYHKDNRCRQLGEARGDGEKDKTRKRQGARSKPTPEYRLHYSGN
jgi:hypothetical protein